MVFQQHIPSDFRDWLDAVRIMLGNWMVIGLPGKRLTKLSADMLSRVPVETAAERLVNQLSDSLVEDLANESMDDLVPALVRSLNENLLLSIAYAMTNWLEKQMVKASGEGTIFLHSTRSPMDVAQWLTRRMADESGVNIFSNNGEFPTIRPDEVTPTIFRIADLAANMIFTKAHKMKG